MMKKIFAIIVTVALLSTGISALASENPATEKDYETLESEFEALKEDYDELSKKYEEALATIEELQSVDENLPEYDISGTVNEITDTTFTVTTSKGNVYTFSNDNFEINMGETVAFSYKGEIDGSKTVQNGTVSDLKVTAAAPAGAEYETGITYSDLSRNPDEYTGKLVKFRGTVIQLIEDTSSDEIQIRFAVNDDYDQIILCGYDKSIVSSRVLEDDWITIYGMSVGLISYESTMGGTITIPAVYIDRIDQE